jgi:hypothetical protein
VDGGETSLNASGFLLAASHDYCTEVAGTLRQRYAECRAASKVFSRPHLNMAL